MCWVYRISGINLNNILLVGHDEYRIVTLKIENKFLKDYFNGAQTEKYFTRNKIVYMIAE